MRPDWKIIAEGRDITAATRHALIDLRIEDGVGEKQDKITITLNNGEGRMAVPRTGATVKPAGGALVMTLAGGGKKPTGEAFPAIAIARRDITTWRVSIAERWRFTAVTARWHDTAAGHDVTLTVGDETGPTYSLKQAYPNAEAARHAARSRLEALSRGKATLNLSLPGNASLAAERRLALSGFGPGIDGPWTTTQAVHAISRSGFTTTLDAERK